MAPCAEAGSPSADCYDAIRGAEAATIRYPDNPDNPPAAMWPLDIHTHDPKRYRQAIVNIDPDMPMNPDGHYSVGLHPWDSGRPDAGNRIAAIEALARDPRIIMIGECGIDTHRGAPIPRQIELLTQQAAIAQAAGKPLLLHIVGAFNEIIHLRQQLRPSEPWIIHGFRGKPQLAQQLLRHGFDLSLGQHFNPSTAAIIPASRLYTETDTSTLSIAEIRRRIDAARTLPT